MRSGGASELPVALQLEEKQLISLMLLCSLDVRCSYGWNVLIYKSCKHSEMMVICCVYFPPFKRGRQLPRLRCQIQHKKQLTCTQFKAFLLDVLLHFYDQSAGVLDLKGERRSK